MISPQINGIVDGVVKGLIPNTSIISAYDDADYGFTAIWDGDINVVQGAANRVATWQSKISANTFQQTTAGNRLQTGLSTINGKNCVSSDGTSNRWASLDGTSKAASIAALGLDFTDFELNTISTQTASSSEALIGLKAATPADVWIPRYRATGNAYISGSALSTYFILTSAFTANTTHLVQLVVTGGEIIIYGNGVELSRQTSTLTAFDAFCLMGRVGNTNGYFGGVSYIQVGSHNPTLFSQNQDYLMGLAGL